MNKFICLTAEEVIENSALSELFDKWINLFTEIVPEWLRFITYLHGNEQQTYLGDITMADFISKYGMRKVSRYLSKNITLNEGEGYKYLIGDDFITYLYQKYSANWERLFHSLFADYNPIDNYNMLEEENVGTYNEYKSDNESNVFGFNTTDETGVPSSIGGISGHTEGDFEKNHRQLTRAGNIGVKTTQSMILEEVQLRTHNFIDIIFSDLSKSLTRPNY